MRIPPRARPFALFVAGAALAACSSAGPSELSEEDQAAVGEADVAVVGGDDLTWDPTELTADAGEVTFALSCEQAVNHNLVVDGEEVAACAPGETASGSMELEAGSYEFVCTVPGHERRMRGALEVS
jgi:plastocyanin